MKHTLLTKGRTRTGYPITTAILAKNAYQTGGVIYEAQSLGGAESAVVNLRMEIWGGVTALTTLKIAIQHGDQANLSDATLYKEVTYLNVPVNVATDLQVSFPMDGCKRYFRVSILVDYAGTSTANNFYSGISFGDRKVEPQADDGRIAAL